MYNFIQSINRRFKRSKIETPKPDHKERLGWLLEGSKIRKPFFSMNRRIIIAIIGFIVFFVSVNLFIAEGSVKPPKLIAGIKILGVNLGEIKTKPMRVFAEECQALGGHVTEHRANAMLNGHTYPAVGLMGWKGKMI